MLRCNNPFRAGERMKRVITLSTLLLTGIVGVITSSSLFGGTRGTDESANGWDAKWFAYDKPSRLAVEESTPTADQVNFWKRPEQMSKAAPAPKVTGPATPLTVGDMDIVRLRFQDVEGGVVSALLCKPHGKPGPFPVVIATHGYTSNKAQVCAQVAPELTKRGFAVLAADMPCHGERPGSNHDIMDKSDWLKAFKTWRQAVVDDRQLLDLAEQRDDLDTRKGMILLGYSMGSWISSVVGPADPRVKAMVLMVGGAADVPPAALRIPQVAATDPRLAIKHFAGRPVLMLNGRTDFIVNSNMTRLLWEAAPQPKQQTWYESGHLLPSEAYVDAAEWISKLK
jgi:dienelactone hydrolase